MADKTKKTAFAKYAVAAVAAILIIGVTVTTVLIKAKKKDVVVIEANNEASGADSSSAQDTKKTKKTTETKKIVSESDTDTKAQASTTVSVSFPIDINKADLAQLCTIDGVGASTAQRIFDYREKVGVISSLDMLLNVEGIGEKTLKKLENYLFVSESDKASAQSTTAAVVTTAKTDEETYKQVNINIAEAKEIAQSLHISLEKAQKIVVTRGKIGGYTSKAEILLSNAITENEFNTLEQYIMI